MLYRIDVSYACAGIIVENNIVIQAAPIFKWMINKDLDYVTKWVQSKKGTIKECSS